MSFAHISVELLTPVYFLSGWLPLCEHLRRKRRITPTAVCFARAPSLIISIIQRIIINGQGKHINVLKAPHQSAYTVCTGLQNKREQLSKVHRSHHWQAGSVCICVLCICASLCVDSLEKPWCYNSWFVFTRSHLSSDCPFGGILCTAARWWHWHWIDTLNKPQPAAAWMIYYYIHRPV